MKSKQNQNNNIGLQQKNSFIQAWINLKDSIFNVLFVLLDKNDDEQEQSLWGLAFESGLDYLQMMSFPFDMAVIKVWNGGQTLQTVIQLSQKLNISSYLPGVNFQLFLVILYSLIFLIVLVILDIIYVSYSFSKKKFRFTWPLVLLAQIVPLFVTVFFLPMTQTLLSVVQCEASNESSVQVMVSFPNVICWQGWHLFHAAVTLLFVSIFVFISSVVALALFQPRMTTNKLTARQNSTAQVVFIMNKIVCQFIFSFTPFEDTWIYCIMLFSFSFWQFWCYMVNQPYYSKKATKFFKVVSTYYFWTNLMLMVSQILSLFNFNGGLVIWLGGLPFLFIIILFQRKSNIGKLFSSNLKFRNGEQLQNHITYVLQLIQKQKKDKNSYMLLIGYIEKHKQICTQEDCPLIKKNKNKKKTKLENQMEQNCIQLLKQLERMYRMGIKKYPECTKLRLSFAFFHLQRTKNKNKAYEQFQKAEQTDPSFQQQFIIYRFKKIIRENLQDDDKDGSSDLIEMIRFDNHISLCEEAMLMSARLHKEFWAELKEQIPNLKKLNDIGSKITQTGNAVKQNFLQISKINSSVPEILYSYAVYLLLIIEDYTQGRELLENAKKLYQDKLIGDDEFSQANHSSSNSEYYQKNNASGKDRVLTPILVVSRNQEKLGKVLNCNLMLTQISGYYKEELCQRDFHKLMPMTYAAAHEFTLKDWSRRDQVSGYFDRTNEGFIRQKSGFIVPVNYTVNYSIVEQEFIVQLRLDSNRATKCMLLTDQMGMVREYNLMARNLLKFSGMSAQLPQRQQTSSPPAQAIYLQQLGIMSYQSQQYKDGIRRAIKIESQQKLCLVKIKSIVMKVDQKQDSEYDNQINNIQKISNSAENIANNDANVPDDMMQIASVTVGYVIEIMPIVQYSQRVTSMQTIEGKTVSRVLKGHQQQQQYSHSQFDSNLESQRLNLINNSILDLYQKPIIEQSFIEYLLQQQKQKTGKGRQQVILHKFQLTEKIKTMRLLDNEIKMVYNQSNDNDYNGGREGMDTEDDREIFKFDDENYQAKLRKAINTNINHIQIIKLKWTSFIFLMLLFTLMGMQLFFSMSNLQKIKSYGERILLKAQQMQYLSKYITGSLIPLYPNTVYFKQMSDYAVRYPQYQEIGFRIENSPILEYKQLKDVLILMHSKLLQYYDIGQIYTLSNVYYNFVNFIYPAFERQVVHIQVDRSWGLLCVGLIIFFSIFMICYWIYISLQLDKKKYDIMIWFLDIPIPYVTHLSVHCDKYLKQFIGIKELMEKKINLDENQNQYQEYNQSTQENKQDEIQEQIKARKSLIAKHRKQTIFSKLNISYIVMLWVLIYSSLVAVLIVLNSEVQYANYQFLSSHWAMTARHVYWESGLNVALALKEKNILIVGDVNISEMSNRIQLQHLNYISITQTIKFNNQIMDYIPEIEEIYRQVYYETLCKSSQSTIQQSKCFQLLKGKLSVGYTVYSKFLVNAPSELNRQIRQANQKYVIPSLVRVLMAWESIMKKNIISTISLCTIMLIVYVVVSLLMFLVFWMMYLKKMNTQLNQTIQMLNMIPFRLLPKSRKETKQFITWIIKQANKKKHQSE